MVISKQIQSDFDEIQSQIWFDLIRRRPDYTLYVVIYSLIYEHIKPDLRRHEKLYLSISDQIKFDLLRYNLIWSDLILFFRG